jgi:hypothetical protein
MAVAGAGSWHRISSFQAKRSSSLGQSPDRVGRATRSRGERDGTCIDTAECTDLSARPDFHCPSLIPERGGRGSPRRHAGRAQRSDLRDKLAKLNVDPTRSSPAEFDAFIKLEAKKWADLIKRAKITVD